MGNGTIVSASQMRFACGQSARAKAIARSRKSVKLGRTPLRCSNASRLSAPLDQRRHVGVAAKVEMGDGGEALGHLGSHGARRMRESVPGDKNSPHPLPLSRRERGV